MKKVLLFLVLIPTLLLIASCDNTKYYHVNRINDYVFETDLYESLDYDYADKYWETTFTEVIDIENRTIYVKIFEKIQENDPEPTYLKINFNERLRKKIRLIYLLKRGL